MSKLTFLLWKARVMLFGYELADKFMRTKYCSKGFHRIHNGRIGAGGTNQRMRYVYYLKCMHCDYIFFASIHDKKRYLKMTDRERSAFRTLLSGSEDEAYKNSGGNVWEEASSRSSLDTK